MRMNRLIWNHLPRSVTALPPLRIYGNILHTVVCLGGDRRQFFGTYFLRNRPQLELIRRLSDQKGESSTLNISVLGCSKGAEVYSILWTILSARPDLKVITHAVDISKEVLEFARGGVYSLKAPELVNERRFERAIGKVELAWNTYRDQNISIFERVSEDEMRVMFDIEGDQVRVKSWIKEEIIWHLGDAGDPEMINVLGPQDMVVANNFLCHMDPPNAERCLRNIARLVNPGGYLFVSGIDVDVRTKVASELGWKPLQDLLEDIHDGDPSVRSDWPFAWWGLEALNKRRNDWKVRYASAFQLNAKAR